LISIFIPVQLLQPREEKSFARATIISAKKKSGRLDGLTIVRFGHAYESGGGLEQYLADLNLALGRRNRLTTIQIQLTTDQNRLNETEETIGESRLVKIPLFVNEKSKHAAINSTPHDRSGQFKNVLRNHFLFAPIIYNSLTKHYLKTWKIPRRAGEPDGAGATFQELLRRFDVDLAVLHSSGGADASEILSVAASAKIPALLVHHFANDRLKSFAIGQQTTQAAGVGGVCGVNVPDYLRGKFSNLSDGIDTDFFRRENAKPVARNSEDPILFLPARLTPTKGQLDLVRAAGELSRQGLRFQIAFAGRVDSEDFLAELKKEIAAAGLEKRVTFVGQLDAAGLRDWYAASAILAFPTRHHEGLPRILLEAQAMELPVVVHDIGGTSEGIENKKTGFLIPVGDRKNLVERLGELLRDPARRKQFGAAGRKRVEAKFSLDALAERHENFYCGASNSSV
jgi:glycosyltransferase involved in cell wall biosynthesis